MADSSDKRRDAQRRTRAQKLAALLRAEDEAALQRFRKQRLAATAEVPDEDLAMLRELLEELAVRLETGDAESWQRVRRAWEVLRPPLEEDEEAPAAEAEEAPVEEAPEGPQPPNLETLPSDAPPIAAKTNTATPSPWLRWSRGDEDGPATPRTTPRPPLPSEPPPRWQPADYRTEGPTAPVEVVTADETAPLGARTTQALYASEDMTKSHALPETRDPLPFRRGDDDPTKQLTYVSMAHGLALDVEEYAALCAERDRAPERQIHIHERYDVVGDRCREGLDRAYQLRFARDPGLRSLWQQHYVRFSSALRRPR